MKPTMSMYVNSEELFCARRAYENGKKAFLDGKEHHELNMPKDFCHEWSDGWNDAHKESHEAK